MNKRKWITAILAIAVIATAAVAIAGSYSNNWKCPNCGYTMTTDGNTGHADCPRCGARMRLQ